MGQMGSPKKRKTGDEEELKDGIFQIPEELSEQSGDEDDFDVPLPTKTISIKLPK